MSEEHENDASANNEEDSLLEKDPNYDPSMLYSAPESRAVRGRSLRALYLLVIVVLLAIAIFALMWIGTDPEVEVVHLSTDGGLTSAKIKVPPRASSSEVISQAVTTPVAIPAPAPVAEQVATQAPAGTTRFQLVTQNFLPAAELASALKLLTQQGYDVRRSEKNKTQQMTRLLVGTYSRKLAKRRLTEVQAIAEGAFLVAAAENKFDLYAGSFASLDGARRAADHLYQRGIRVEERSVEIPLPQTRLSFGSFVSREQARQVATQLLKAGLAPVEVEALPVKGSEPH